MSKKNTDQSSVYKVRLKDGTSTEVEIGLDDYHEAAEHNMSLSQHLNRKVPDYDPKYGTPMEQAMAHAGLFIARDQKHAIHPPTMKQVLDGSYQINAGVITRNDGSSNNTPSGRLLFPEVILQLIESELNDDHSDFVNGYNSMVAQTTSVNSPKVDQPIINVTGPRADEFASQPISQLAEPAAMISITLSEVSRRIPTRAIGLQISDEALQATTLDLVGLAMTQQARQERIRLIEGSISAMVSGDADVNESALASVTAQSLDGAIDANGAMSQKAWIHYLRKNYRKMSISHIMCDIDTALAIEGRDGKPTVQTDNPTSPRIDSLFSVENLGISPPKILLLESSLIGANTVVGLDRRYAIRRVVNVSATYSAIQDYVMRRSTGFRVDYGEISHKLFPDAWSVMTLTV
jgi:hypothetical protein